MTTEQQLAANLLATGAETATTAAGPCCLCQHAILQGDRVAGLVTSGRLAHVACIARAALRPQPLTRIRHRTVIR